METAAEIESQLVKHIDEALAMEHSVLRMLDAMIATTDDVEIKEKLRAALNGYIAAPALGPDVDRYLVPPLLGDDAGVCGAMALGQRAAGRV